MKDQVVAICKLRRNFHTSSTGGKQDVINICSRELLLIRLLGFSLDHRSKICTVKFFNPRP